MCDSPGRLYLPRMCSDASLPSKVLKCIYWGEGPRTRRDAEKTKAHVSRCECETTSVPRATPIMSHAIDWLVSWGDTPSTARPSHARQEVRIALAAICRRALVGALDLQARDRRAAPRTRDARLAAGCGVRVSQPVHSVGAAIAEQHADLVRVSVLGVRVRVRVGLGLEVRIRASVSGQDWG